MSLTNKSNIFFLGTVIVALIYIASCEVLTWGIYLLPIVYAIFLPIYSKKLFVNGKISFSVSALLIMYWIRLVFLPVFAYSRSNSLNIDYSLPILLTIYEFVVVSFFVLFYKFKFSYSKKISLKGSPKVYILYGLIALITFVFFARGLGIYDLFFKEINTSERDGDIINLNVLFIRQIVDSGILFTYLLIAYHYSKKYESNQKSLYFKYVLLISLLFLSIITGERRTSILYKAFAITCILIDIFPTQKKKVLKYVITTSLVVLCMMTIYKSYNAYLYDSYWVALNSKSNSEALGGEVLDSYFFGLNTIYKNIEFINSASLSLSNLFFDFFRSIFGVHFLLKDFGFTTTQLYNLSIYSGEQTSGFLFSSISYGYAYLGLFLAPLIPLMNVYGMIIFEKLLHKTSSIEMKYLYAVIFLRLGYGLFDNYAPLINMITQILFMYGSFYLIAKLCYRK